MVGEGDLFLEAVAMVAVGCFSFDGEDEDVDMSLSNEEFDWFIEAVTV
jgi:hypothetical protein